MIVGKPIGTSPKVDINKNGVIAILVLLIVLLFWPLQQPWIKGEEARRAIVAMEMLDNHNFIQPTIHHYPYFNKPPVFNWMIAGLMEITGRQDRWIIRLPTVFSFLAIGLFLFLLLRRYSQFAGEIALGFLFSADLLLYFTFRAEIDVFYTLLVLLQVLLFFHFVQKNKPFSAFCFSYLFCALGCLTKGVPSLAFQILTVFPYLIYLKKAKLLVSVHHISGIVLFGLICGGYFYAYHLDGGNLELFLSNLLFESSKRTQSGNGFQELLLHFLEFPIGIIKILAPFSVLFFLLFNRKLNREKSALEKFSILFIVCNLWIYWISVETKDRYHYMFLPFFLILMIEKWSTYRKMMPIVGQYLAIVFLTIPMLLAIGVFVYMTTSFNETISLQHYIWATALIVLICIILLGKKYRNAFGTMVICMIALRLLVNVAYIPASVAQSDSRNTVQWVQESIQTIGSHPILYYSPVWNEQVTSKVAGFTLVDVTIPRLRDYPWEITYYFNESLGSTIPVSHVLENGKYYFALRSSIMMPIKEISAYKESKYPEEIVLFTLE